VPSGFVVTTAAYSRHIAAPTIARTIEQQLADVSETNSPRTKGAAAEFAQAIEAVDIDAATATAVTAAYHQLYSALAGSLVPAAVRSSATGEDGRKLRRSI
jgi:phosphoenolpyruvate synthase/pyruvate phosphate dikinase